MASATSEASPNVGGFRPNSFTDSKKLFLIVLQGESVTLDKLRKKILRGIAKFLPLQNTPSLVSDCDDLNILPVEALIIDIVPDCLRYSGVDTTTEPSVTTDGNHQMVLLCGIGLQFRFLVECYRIEQHRYRYDGGCDLCEALQYIYGLYSSVSTAYRKLQHRTVELASTLFCPCVLSCRHHLHGFGNLLDVFDRL